MDKIKRQGLLKEKEKIEKELKSLENVKPDYGDDPDVDEESHETEDINLKMGMVETFKSRLREIEKELSGDDSADQNK